MLLVSCKDEYKLTKNNIDILSTNEGAIAVYANLGTNETTQYIRINRAFSTNTFSNHDHIYDSIYVSDDYSVEFHRVEGNDTINTKYCRDTLVPKYDGDSFETDSVRLFYFPVEALTNESYDKMDGIIEITTPQGEKITASTRLIGPYSFKFPPSPPYANWREFATDNEFRVVLRRPLFGMVFSVSAYVGYVEIKPSAKGYDSVYQEFRMRLAEEILPAPVDETNSVRSYYNSNNLFYEGLKNDIIKNGDTINTTKRLLNKIYFEAIVGNKDMAFLKTFSNGFSQDPHFYSNVSGGYGFVSAFNRIKTHKMMFDSYTLDTVKELYSKRFKIRGQIVDY